MQVEFIKNLCLNWLFVFCDILRILCHIDVKYGNISKQRKQPINQILSTACLAIEIWHFMRLSGKCRILCQLLFIKNLEFLYEVISDRVSGIATEVSCKAPEYQNFFVSFLH